MKRIRDIDFEGGKLKPDFDVGITFENDRGCFTTVIREPGKRHVSFDWSSFVGVSIGAMHYYGKIRFWGHNFRVDSLKQKEDPRWMHVGKIINMAGAFNKPDDIDGLELELTRELTQAEIDKYPYRWRKRYGLWSAGDRTDCFETLDDVIKRGKEVYDQIFEKGVYSGLEWEIDFSTAEDEAFNERPENNPEPMAYTAFARAATVGAVMYGGDEDEDA
jgi:hypothetical protein